MKLVTLSKQEDVDMETINQIALLDRPKPNQRRAIPRDEVQMDSFYGPNANLVELNRIVEMNPGCQLFVHIGQNSTGFWLPVTLEEE